LKTSVDEVYMESGAVWQESRMRKKIKIASLILSGLLVVSLLAACSGAQSGGSPESPKAPQGSGAPPAGQPPAGVPGAIPGALKGGTGQKEQQVVSLPEQANIVVRKGTVTVDSYANL
jgi:hypothetical protein